MVRAARLGNAGEIAAEFNAGRLGGVSAFMSAVVSAAPPETQRQRDELWEALWTALYKPALDILNQTVPVPPQRHSPKGDSNWMDFQTLIRRTSDIIDEHVYITLDAEFLWDTESPVVDLIARVLIGGDFVYRLESLDPKPQALAEFWAAVLTRLEQQEPVSEWDGMPELGVPDAWWEN